MTELRIKLHQPQALGQLQAGAVARVRRVAEVSGEVAKTWWSQEKPVNVAGGDGQLGEDTVFELPAGGYFSVDITPPRGPDISREFLVEEGQVREETITMDVSPHEYLGWQQFAGIVRPEPYRKETDRSPAAPPSTGMERLDRLMTLGRQRIESLYARTTEVPQVFRADVPPSEQAWPQVAETIPGAAPDWAIAGGSLGWPGSWDEEYATWFREMPTPEQGIDLILRLKKDAPPDDALSAEFPRWISFETSGQVDLASVPWAWWGAMREEGEEIRLLYDRVRPSSVDRDRPGRCTISVQDRRWFGLLEFLASGRLNRAGDIFDHALESEHPEELFDPEIALYGKVKGPLVAAAGAIVLIARAESTAEMRWDPWLRNLSRWFPGIPDGPILLGCRRVAQAQSLDDLKGAFEHLRQGIARGIPFFSASIRMLTMALAQIGGDIPEADEARRFVAPVSSRVDPGQPFTVIRL